METNECVKLPPCPCPEEHCAAPTRMHAEHFLMDLRELIQSLEMRRASMLEAVRSFGGEWDSVREAGWEGSFVSLVEVMKELRTMEHYWSHGEAAYHRTEKLLEGDP